MLHHRKRKASADKNDSFVSKDVTHLSEDPEKLGGNDQVNYELTQSAAGSESTASKPHPSEVEETNDY